ncbi:flagellin [Litorivicinus sp.]|nr:flagellin [Litorivicinus sp.]
MALTVNTNVMALNAQRHSAATQDEMASAMERLASGKRINSAVDDAAGLAIAARMEAQISGLAQAVRNAGDAISLVNTAEGALQETTAILQRIRELSIQSAGGAPSNADRVNLNKEVIQLQEELSRITNTTRFNGEILLNGTFTDKDFQIGQTNNEEISVNIGDMRPERIGAFTQNTLDNVGYVNVGDKVSNLTNGVNQQTLTIAVGSEVPRVVAINSGDSARVISDKMNQSGAMINTRATTTLDAYVTGEGTFSYTLSSDSAPGLADVITVGGTAASKARTMVSEINARYSEHNVSASIQVDSSGNEFVRMYQDQGFNIRVDNFVTAGTTGLDFDGDGIAEVTGGTGKTAAVAGGKLVIDAPSSFLISSDDTSNTILQGTRASLDVSAVSSVPTAYQDLTFDVAVGGVSKSITLAAPPPDVAVPATSAIVPMEFTSTAQTQAASGQQVGAMRPATYAVGPITVRTGDDAGDKSTQFSLNVNGLGRQDFDIAQALTDLGITSTETPDTVATSAVTTGTDTITITGHGYESGQKVTYDSAGGTAITGLSDDTDYYVIKVDDNNIKLAETYVEATASTAIPIVISGQGNNAQTFTPNASVTKSQFVSAMQTTINQNGLLTGDHAVTVSVNATGQVELAAAGGAGTIVFEEHSNQRASTVKTIASADVSTASDTITITGHGFVTGDILTYANGGGTDLDQGGTPIATVYVIRVDDDTIKLASSAQNAFLGTSYDLDDAGNDAQTLTKAAADGMAASLTKSSKPGDGTSSESGTGGSVVLGATDNVTNGDSAVLGSVKPFGVNTLTIAGTDANTIATSAITTGTDSITITSHGYVTGQKLTYGNGGGADATGLTDGTDYYVIKNDSDTIKLAATYADAVAGTVVTISGTGNNAQTLTNSNDTFTMAISGGSPTTLDVADDTYYSLDQLATAIQTAIDASPFAQTGDFPIVVSVTEDSNGDQGITFSSADGYSIELGGTEFLSDAGALNINPARTAPDVGALTDRTYAATLNTATIATTDVDTGDNHITETSHGLLTGDVVKYNANGGTAITGLTDGQYYYVIRVDANDYRLATSEANATAGTAIGLTGQGNASQTFTNITSDKESKLALSVNGSSFLDLDIANQLTLAGADATVTSTEFTTALQATIDASGAFSGDNAVTVSVTSAGLLKLDVASGSGTIIVREHSDTIAAGTNGLVETLTGRNANEDHGSLATVSNGGASQSATDGSLTLGTEANAAIVTDGLTSSDANYVKTFGVAPITLDSTNNTLNLSINSGGSTAVTVAAGTYTTMADFATAIQTAVDASPQLTGQVTVGALQDSSSPYAWGLTFTQPSGYSIAYSGSLVTDSNALNTSAGTVAALTSTPAGAAASRSTISAGVYSNGVDLSTDNTITFEVTDNVTGGIRTETLTLGSTDSSVSFSDYLTLIAAAANTSFSADGYSFTSAGTGSSMTLTMLPAGDYTVALSGTSVTQALGGSVSATGNPSNMDGYVFETMNDVVAEMNREFTSAGLGLVASYSRGGDTFTFSVTEGRADSSNTLAFSGAELANVGMVGDLTAVGGGTQPAETVRYVSQIDISTRDEAVLAMTVVDAALETLAANRGALGAVANRLESTISNLLNISENTAESMSRVMDADFAAESTRLARAQILQEASVAILAQANASAQSVLKLLN